MASHAMATGTARRKGERNPNYHRREPWGPPRSGVPGSHAHAVNGSPYSGRRRDAQQQQQHHQQQQQNQQQQQQHQQQTPVSDHEQYKLFLTQMWNKTRTELWRSEKSTTLYAERYPCADLEDFVPVNVDECLARAHQQDKPDH